MQKPQKRHIVSKLNKLSIATILQFYGYTGSQKSTFSVELLLELLSKDTLLYLKENKIALIHFCSSHKTNFCKPFVRFTSENR